MHIPIDYVVGTSMGAIVGGLYAIGYTSHELDSLMMVQDWKTLLSNDLPRSQQPYDQRMARKRYQVNIPFEKSSFTENSVYYRDAGIKVRRSSLQTFPKILARPGLIDGTNLLDEFSRLTYLYRDSVSYNVFPHSFACVATDLVTGKEVVLRQGRLAQSMRASMSIPGVFYPINIGNQVLVDGGVVNNYPVNVARAMGADIIIGVELNSATINARELQSFASIFERLIGTLGSDLHEQNVIDTDILIRPSVKQFPVMGFDTLNLRQLIDIGYRTALLNRGQLELLKQILSSYPEDSVTFVSSKAVRSSGYIGHGGGWRDSTNHPNNQVAIGLRFDSEEAAAALLNINMDRTEQSGMEYNLTTRLSVNPWVEARVSYAWDDIPKVNISAKYRFTDVNRFYDKNIYALNYNLYGGAIYLSNLLSRSYDLRIGIRYEHFAVHELMRSELSSYSYTDTKSHESHVAIYTLLRNDKFDVPYFPTRGFAYGVEGSFYMKNRVFGGNNFGELQGTFSFAAPLGESTALLPVLYTRHLVGRHIPLIYSNAMGGYLSHRYLRQQFPFVGLVGSEFMKHNLTIFRVELRQRLFDDIYASSIVNYAYSIDDLDALSESKKVWGIALQLAYDTTIGPLMLSAHWSDLYHKMGLYFSLGFEF
jgi:NTE family protein